MSQSDYISKKKILFELQEQSKLPRILTSQFYTRCLKYSILKNNIDNNDEKNIYNTLQTTTKNKCPNFIICMNTNKRPNRIKRPY